MSTTDPTAPAPAPPPTAGHELGSPVLRAHQVGLRRWRIAAGTLATSLLALWIAFVLGVPSAGLARWLVPPAMIALGGWAWTAFRAGWGGRSRVAAVGLLLLALAVRLTGVSHEVFERAYLDEGTYYHHANEINQGKWWRGSFVYPHLTYYTYSFALWLSNLYPELRHSWASAASGTQEGLAHEWLILRLVVALLSALAVIPVRRLGSFIAGPAGGVLAGLLYVFCPMFNEGSHLIISDYPAACLATFCLAACCNLIERRRMKDFVVAGLFAGAAAAVKYPAGTVIFAVLAIWVGKRFVARRLDLRSLLELGACGAAALLAFLAPMPSFFAAPSQAIFGPRGMLFGLRQYSGGGWIGVLPDSNLAYYVTRLAESFWWPALVLAAATPLVLRRGARRHLFWLIPFPLAYFLLVVSMNMVVERNLAPIVPALAVFAGAGAVGLARRAHERLSATVPATALLAAASLLVVTGPAITTVRQAVELTRPSTRDLMAAWIADNLPGGATILREGYTPRLDDRWAVRHVRFATRLDLDQLAQFDYVLLAGASYGRFLRGDQVRESHHFTMAERYREILERWPLVHQEETGRGYRGPELKLFRTPGTPREPGNRGALDQELEAEESPAVIADDEG